MDSLLTDSDTRNTLMTSHEGTTAGVIRKIAVCEQNRNTES